MGSRSFNFQFVVAAILFITAGLAALVFSNYLLVVLPFLWLMLPAIARVCIHKTAYLYFALFALLPLSTEINITPSLGFDFPDEILMVLITGLFILAVVYKPAIFPKAILHSPLITLLTLHLLWLIIACFYSMDGWLSVKFVLAKTWYIVPFVILPSIFLNSKEAIKKMAFCLLLPMGFVVVQSLIRHAFYGFSFLGIKETLSPFFRNHVTYSAMLVCLMAVLFAMYRLTPKTNKYKALLLAGLWLGGVAIVLSYSRGAWVAAVAGLIAYYAIRKKLMGWMISLAVITTLVSVLWLTHNNNYLRFAPDYNSTIFHQQIADHLQATITLKDVSNAERFYRWVAAANMIADKPLTGFGPNNFYNYYRSYTVTPFQTWVSDNPEHSSVHNYFLLTLLEQGVPGLLFFCSLYFAMLVYSQRLYHQLTDPFYKTVSITIGVLLTCIGTLIFMSDLIETDKTGSLFWLCLGLLVVLDAKRKVGSLEERESVAKSL